MPSLPKDVYKRILEQRSQDVKNKLIKDYEDSIWEQSRRRRNLQRRLNIERRSTVTWQMVDATVAAREANAESDTVRLEAKRKLRALMREEIKNNRGYEEAAIAMDKRFFKLTSAVYKKIRRDMFDRVEASRRNRFEQREQDDDDNTLMFYRNMPDFSEEENDFNDDL